jgi:hypothetical protein
MLGSATRTTWLLHAAWHGASNTQPSVFTEERLKTLDSSTGISHKNGSTQIDLTEVDCLQITPPKDGFGKVSPLKEGSSQESLSEIGFLERRMAQIGSYEVGADEMGMVEVEMFELGFAEISNHFCMTAYPAVPGLSSLAQ